LNAFDGLSSLALHICVTSEDDIAGDLEEVRHAYGLSYDALNSYLFDLRKQRLEDL
jgi:L-rhamnose isomerase